jgi:hypothetical protein
VDYIFKFAFKFKIGNFVIESKRNSSLVNSSDPGMEESISSTIPLSYVKLSHPNE